MYTPNKKKQKSNFSKKRVIGESLVSLKNNSYDSHTQTNTRRTKLPATGKTNFNFFAMYGTQASNDHLFGFR